MSIFFQKNILLKKCSSFIKKKYAVLEDHLYPILRALDYFEDAEQESQMPRMLKNIFWEEVKEYFRKETQILTEKKITN